jgi:hypothetical protein
MDHKINTSVLAKHLSMDYVLKNFCATSTYMKYLDIRFIKENNSYISVLPYKSNLIGNPDLKVLHGGITVALSLLQWHRYFMEMIMLRLLRVLT